VETGKKINEKTIQFREVIKHNHCDWCTWKFWHKSSIRRLMQTT